MNNSNKKEKNPETEGKGCGCHSNTARDPQFLWVNILTRQTWRARVGVKYGENIAI